MIQVCSAQCFQFCWVLLNRVTYIHQLHKEIVGDEGETWLVDVWVSRAYTCAAMGYALHGSRVYAGWRMKDGGWRMEYPASSGSWLGREREGELLRGLEKPSASRWMLLVLPLSTNPLRTWKVGTTREPAGPGLLNPGALNFVILLYLTVFYLCSSSYVYWYSIHNSKLYKLQIQ